MKGGDIMGKKIFFVVFFLLLFFVTFFVSPQSQQEIEEIWIYYDGASNRSNYGTVVASATKWQKIFFADGTSSVKEVSTHEWRGCKISRVGSLKGMPSWVVKDIYETIVERLYPYRLE